MAVKIKIADSVKVFIAYYRVSTQKQGKSGLGLDAQVEAVQAYCRSQGGVVLKFYKEVETGKIADRPEMVKALAHARRIKATMVFAKLDRLARNARFLLGLVESGADLVFCDFPSIPPGATGKFILTQMAAVAELEAGLTSQRTKAALGAFVANKWVPRKIREAHPGGVPADLVELYAGKLGSLRPGAPRLSREHAVKGSAAAAVARKTMAVEAYSDLTPIVSELRGEGLSLRQIAARLDEDGHTTRTGRPWNPVQVTRVLALAS